MTYNPERGKLISDMCSMWRIAHFVQAYQANQIKFGQAFHALVYRGNDPEQVKRWLRGLEPYPQRDDWKGM